ncbi:uncharacterized protein LOC113136250 [Mastacembelus armatus]|uniref:uncharacterized protein LOC113136250 n=1 Tax=Mastacembelus armatus TaxID=205130 RepID=UPI001436B3C6|nr:uncharacterized protein LOC113136250 [Mastacembelus armatus]
MALSKADTPASCDTLWLTQWKILSLLSRKVARLYIPRRAGMFLSFIFTLSAAGLSSNMEHTFSENYTESALPVLDTGSFVKPIPKVELVRSFPSEPAVLNADIVCVVGSSKPESHSVSTGKRLLKPAIPNAVSQHIFPPQATLIALTGKGQEEETVTNTLPGTTTIRDKDLSVKRADVNCCVMNTEMATGENPSKPKRPPLILQKPRKSNQQWKKAGRKKWKPSLLLLVSLTFIVPVFTITGAKPAGDQKLQCHTCMDKNRCPDLMSIYASDDTLVYNRSLDQPLPGCCASFSSTAKRCAVCNVQSNITIICPEAIRKFDVEANGVTILNISPGCEKQLLCSWAHGGVSQSSVLFVIAVAALVTYCG